MKWTAATVCPDCGWGAEVTGNDKPFTLFCDCQALCYVHARWHDVAADDTATLREKLLQGMPLSDDDRTRIAEAQGQERHYCSTHEGTCEDLKRERDIAAANYANASNDRDVLRREVARLTEALIRLRGTADKALRKRMESGT